MSGLNTRDTVQDVLHSLSYLCNNFDYFIIGGDFNTCLSNTDQPMTRQIMLFVKDEELLCVSQMADECNIVYTFEYILSKVKLMVLNPLLTISSSVQI